MDNLNRGALADMITKQQLGKCPYVYSDYIADHIIVWMIEQGYDIVDTQKLMPARGADYFGMTGTRGLDADHPTLKPLPEK